MVERSTIHSNDTDELTLEIQEEIFDNTPKKVALRSRIDANLTVTVNGNEYKFSKAGAVVEVNEADVQELLSKRYGRKACCGANSAQANLMFELA